MGKAAKAYQILMLLFLVELVVDTGCKKEPVKGQFSYKYAWFFTNNCGGQLAVEVPNSFHPFSGRNYQDWEIAFSVLFSQDTCNGIPNQPDFAVKSFLVEVRDIHNIVYFSSTDIHSQWDGRNWMNNGAKVSQGQYLWKFRLVDIDGVIHEERGVVNVIY